MVHLFFQFALEAIRPVKDSQTPPELTDNHVAPLCRLENPRDRLGDPSVPLHFPLQLVSASARKAVVTGPAVFWRLSQSPVSHPFTSMR
jgi:hypothetical protein